MSRSFLLSERILSLALEYLFYFFKSVFLLFTQPREFLMFYKEINYPIRIRAKIKPGVFLEVPGKCFS